MIRKTDRSFRADGLVYSRTQTDAVFEAERTEMINEQKDVDACRLLWRAVLQKTVEDLSFLRSAGLYKLLKKHKQENLRRIWENPPAEFVRGAWFEQICAYLDVDPNKIRQRIQEAEEAVEI